MMGINQISRGEKRVLIGTKVPPKVRQIIEEIALEEDRSIGSVAARLLAESPRVRERLDEIAA